MNKNKKAIVMYVTKEERKKLEELSKITGLTHSALLATLLNAAHKRVVDYCVEASK